MDMDLDELDQEVNKLMVQPKGRRPAPRREAAPARPATPAAGPVVAKTTAMPSALAAEPAAPAHESHAIPVSRPMPKVPERRRMHPGVMDIIQPQPSVKVTPPSNRPARVAPDITPVSPSVKPEPPKLFIPPAAPTTHVSEPPEPSPADVSDEVLASLSMLDSPNSPAAAKPTAEARQESREKWPDPLDFHDFGGNAEKTEEKPVEPAPTLQNATPFLATKVEKRPLGAYADADQPKLQVTPPKAELAEASLHSNQHLSAQPEEPAHGMDDLRQMAIPPQYQATQSDKKEELHNVYDTKEYHAAPQMMPTHHKGSSPWLTVGIVVLIVLIIAAVAIGYFMMTGTFDITNIW